MDAVEIVSYQIDNAKGQIIRVLKGLDDSALNFRASENSLSVGEIIDHLGEVYQAVITISAGGKHDWGSFSLKSTTLDEMLAETMALRDKAAASVLKSDDESLKMACDFLISHDNYHVGQLVTARLGIHSSWNFLEIYGE